MVDVVGCSHRFEFRVVVFMYEGGAWLCKLFCIFLCNFCRFGECMRLMFYTNNKNQTTRNRNEHQNRACK